MNQQNEALTVPTANEFRITRVFNAPRELVFQAFTEAEQLQHWWGPIGFTLNVARLDLRPGGEFLYSMTSPDGQEMWGKFVYHDIKAPERIVFVNSFTDSDGMIIRPPFTQNWPLEIKNTWTLTEENGQTTLTLQGQPINATSQEHQTFENNHESMRQGFNGTFDQLTVYLATIQK